MDKIFKENIRIKMREIIRHRFLNLFFPCDFRKITLLVVK